MTNRMLINATQSQEEIRFAIVHNNVLDNVYIETPGSKKKGNVYKGIITRVEASLQAAFIDFGAPNKHGFLPFKEIAPIYFGGDPSASEQDTPKRNIADGLREGQEVMVQVEKEERGNKGAALTTYITLAGSYLVLMPNTPKAGGISRRIEGPDRDEIREIFNSLAVSEDMGLIVRTAGVGKSQEELQWDLDILLHLWSAINSAYQTQAGPFLIHRESDIITRAIRDYLRKDIHEIIVDNEDVYKHTKEQVERIWPEFADQVRLHEEPVPLFTKFRVEKQIETAFEREVRLPSGGSLVIQQTEAMVAIDVNSSRDTKGEHIEATAFNTNKEAAIEIARQLRIRDLGGLIVVDFIDMMSTDNQRQVVDIFHNHVKTDRARVQFSRISRFGLLEISRQRLRPSLNESTQFVCPRCDGEGTIRNIESLALLILRAIHDDALQDRTIEIRAQVPLSIATYLLNEKRADIQEIETASKTLVRIIPNQHIQTPEYKIDRIKEGGRGGRGGRDTAHQRPAHHLIQKEGTAEYELQDAKTVENEPAVKDLQMPERPVAGTAKKSSGLLQRLSKLVFGAGENEKEKPSASNVQSPETSGDQPSGQQGHQPRRRDQSSDPRRSSRRGGRRRQHSSRNRSGGGNAGGGNTNNDNTSRDNTGSGNTGRGNAGGGNTSRGNTGRGNTGRGNTGGSRHPQGRGGPRNRDNTQRNQQNEGQNKSHQENQGNVTKPQPQAAEKPASPNKSQDFQKGAQPADTIPLKNYNQVTAQPENVGNIAPPHTPQVEQPPAPILEGNNAGQEDSRPRDQQRRRYHRRNRGGNRPGGGQQQRTGQRRRRHPYSTQQRGPQDANQAPQDGNSKNQVKTEDKPHVSVSSHSEPNGNKKED